MRHSLLAIILWIAAALGVRAAEVMPPKPARWFNDYAGVVPAATVRELDEKLERFERDTSNQVVVAVWRDMQSDSSVQDYTFRIFQHWQLGQRDRNNGIALFVFINPRKMFIQVGYGLEGALPDARAKRIIEDEIAPRFKRGDYGLGLAAGMDAVLAATKDEYKGTGRTVRDTDGIPWVVVLAFFLAAVKIIMVFLQLFLNAFGLVLSDGLEVSGRRWRWENLFGAVLEGMLRAGRGRSSSGGSGRWSSGGGGRSGGGGAGGSW